MASLRGLYAILDVDSLAQRGLGILDFAQRVLAARPAVMQLRAKHSSSRDTLDLLRGLAPVCREAKVMLYANDRPDLALLAGCDGVHVGQEDLSVSQVRQIAPSLRVGISTHDPRQLEAALTEKPDYVAFGPVFATATKHNPDPVVGLGGLAEARRIADGAGTLLVAIGGIDENNAAAVASHAELAAVIGALLPRGSESLDAVTKHARELHLRLGGST